MPTPTRPAPPPLQIDTARVVVGGIIAWTVALVVLLLLGDRVDRVWTWTAVAAIVLAVGGLAIMRWQGQGRRGTAASGPAPGARGPGPGARPAREGEDRGPSTRGGEERGP